MSKSERILSKPIIDHLRVAARRRKPLGPLSRRRRRRPEGGVSPAPLRPPRPHDRHRAGQACVRLLGVQKQGPAALDCAQDAMTLMSLEFSTPM